MSNMERDTPTEKFNRLQTAQDDLTAVIAERDELLGALREALAIWELIGFPVAVMPRVNAIKKVADQYKDLILSTDDDKVTSAR